MSGGRGRRSVTMLTSDGIMRSEVAIANVSASTHSREGTPEGRRRYFLPLRRYPGAAVNPFSSNKPAQRLQEVWMNNSGLVNATRKLLAFLYSTMARFGGSLENRGAIFQHHWSRSASILKQYLLCLGGTRISMLRI